jgi:molecular chaperone GrpE
MENPVQNESELEKQGESGTDSSAVQQSGQEEVSAVALSKKLQDELTESKDKYLRLYAEFDNYRRRTTKEKYDLIQSANESLIASLLPVLDDFGRADKAFVDKKDKAAEGFFLIENKFKKILESAGVKPMDTEIGSDLNPDLHEAITQLPTSDEQLKGKIVDVVEKGYFLSDKVVRHAKVIIGN